MSVFMDHSWIPFIILMDWKNMDIMDWIGEKEHLVLKHSIHNGVLQSYHLANSGTKVWLLGHPSEAIVANSDKRG